MKVNGNLTMDAAGKIENANMEALGAAPATVLVEGRIYYNTAGKMYYRDSTSWVPFASEAFATNAANAVDAVVQAVIAASGGIYDTDGTFLAAANTGLDNVTGATTLLGILDQLDAAITTASGVDTLAELTDVTVTGQATGSIMYADSATTWVVAAPGATSGVQAYDAGLDSIAGLTTAADTMIYTTAADTYATASLTSFARTLLDDADAATMRTTLGVVIGTDVQAYDAGLDALSNVTGTGFMVQTGADTFITTSLVAGSGALAGLSLTDASGTGDVPTFGLSVTGLAAEAGTIQASDLFVMHDGINNVKVTLTQLLAGVVAAGLPLGDLSDVAVVNASTASDAINVLVGDGASAYDTQVLTAGTNLTADTAGTTVVLNVDDAFLLNTGDTLDSGTLTIASGAAINAATGSTISMVDAPTSANELTNKAYVDALVAAGASWKNPVVDSDLVDVLAAEAATPVATYGLSAGDGVAFIATAGFTTTLGGGTPLVVSAGDIYNLQMVTGSTWDYSLVETPLTAGDRFIISAEHGTIGTGLSSLVVDGFALANADLIEFTGTGDGSSAASWAVPDGRSGNAGGGTEIAQGVTVLNADPDSIHYGHTFLYDAVSNSWVEISGPGSIGAGVGLSYTGTTLNVGMGAGIIALPADEVGVDLYATNNALILTNDGSSSSTVTGAQLNLLLAGTTLDSTAGLKVKDAGITATQIATSVAGLGIAGGAGTALSFAPAELTAETVLGTDSLVFSDASDTDAPKKTTVALFMNDLNIVNGITADGMLVRTAEDTYASRTLTASTADGDEGLSVVNGDGVAGNPTVGLDILGLTAEAGTLSLTDVLPMYDGINNVKVTVQQLADAVGAATSLNELADAEVTDFTAGDVLVADGTDSYDQKTVQHTYVATGVAQTSYTITHDLGQFVSVTVLESATNEVLIPQSITMTNATTTVITVSTAVLIKAILVGFDPATSVVNFT